MHSKEELEKSMFWGAFRHHALDVAQLLVQEGYWYEFDKYTTLQLAISPSKELEETDVEPLVTLVLDEKKRRLNKREFSAYINQQRKGDGATALILAVDSGYIEIAKKLLDLGADPNKSDSRGFTPLFIAFWNENVKLIQLLLDRGADVNSVVQFTNPEKVPEDIKCMLDVTQPISLLGLSLNNKRREFLEMFLPYINGENKDKIYPLLSGRAIYEGNTGLANLLIENGFDATSVMQLPNNTDYRTAKSVIMVFVANGMPITTIPVEKLDDDMIWAYVRRCLTEPGVLVVTPEKPFEKGVMARKTIEAFRRRSAIEPLPAPYCTMVLNFCDRACEPEIEIVENVVQTPKIVREMPEEKNSSFEVVSGAKPTQTQIRAIKMSNVARKKALQGPGQTSRKEKESEESVSKEPLSTVFS